MKKKNPLFVVHGDTVEESTGGVDLLIKKMGLMPVIEAYKEFLNFLANQVETYEELSVLVQILKWFEAVFAKLGKQIDRLSLPFLKYVSN